MDSDPEIAYIRWQDASYDTEETPIENCELADLEEVGFLLSETNEAVKISVEHQEGATTARLTVNIPRVNIEEFYRVSLVDFLRWMKRRNKS